MSKIDEKCKQLQDCRATINTIWNEFPNSVTLAGMESNGPGPRLTSAILWLGRAIYEYNEAVDDALARIARAKL